MTDEKAFLAAIKASPADDLPRLVFADWLDEHGQDERAAFIRCQCGGEKWTGRRRPLAIQIIGTALLQLLLDEGGGRASYENKIVVSGWRGPVWMVRGGMRNRYADPDAYRDPLPRLRYYITRGFLERVTMPAALWLAHGDAILAGHPVTAVELTTRPYRIASGRTHNLIVALLDEDRGYDLPGERYPEADGVAKRLLTERYPGVTFTLPPPPQDAFEGAREAGRRAAIDRERRVLDAFLGPS